MTTAMACAAATQLHSFCTAIPDPHTLQFEPTHPPLQPPLLPLRCRLLQVPPAAASPSMTPRQAGCWQCSVFWLALVLLTAWLLGCLQQCSLLQTWHRVDPCLQTAGPCWHPQPLMACQVVLHASVFECCMFEWDCYGASTHCQNSALSWQSRATKLLCH